MVMQTSNESLRRHPWAGLHSVWKAAARYAREIRRLYVLSAQMEGDEVGSPPRIYALRIVIHRAQYWRFVDFLQQAEHPVLGEVDAANPRLRFKLFHAYRHAGLDIERRVNLLIDHYDLARELFGDTMFRSAHIATDGFLLCSVVLPDGKGVLPVRLTRYPRLRREGELSMGLYDPFGTLLYTLTFSLCRNGDGRSMFIGSLIGETPLDNIRHLTKLMSGLRPQALMLFLAQAVCRYYALDSLLAVGRSGHVFAGSRLEGRLLFDYDAFWQEHEGQPLAEDPAIYRLPTHAVRRAEADIPSHKRSQYRRRYAFLDGVEAELAARLNQASQ